MSNPWIEEPRHEASRNREAMLEKLTALDAEHATAFGGGGEKYVERHPARG